MRQSLSKPQTQKTIELRARQMRSSLTASEQKLWNAINAGNLGVWFRRQVPLGNYIADFAAPSVRLVVEVDGAYHARRKIADARRDRMLTRMGYRVLRLDAASVQWSLPRAVSQVRQTLAQLR